MERAISEMEKIRRAEEIYAKRRNLNDTVEIDRKPKSIYKYLFQGLVLFNIIITVVAVQNSKYIFTENFIKQVSSYNINLKEKIEKILTPDSNKLENEKSITKENNAQNIEQPVENSTQDSVQEAVPGESNNVQGATLVENEVAPPKELSQIEQDAIFIKENYSVILPISGTKTSGFGNRDSENLVVTPYHTGVDIAAVKGTVINSATTGTVTWVSNKGDYGKHLKICTDNFTVLYAHCSKIYVSEGDQITQGQPIAEVGSTRK